MEPTSISAPEISSGPPERILILDAVAIDRAIRRIAHEIIESNDSLEKLVLIGIPTRGIEVAHRIAVQVGKSEGVEPEVGVIDVTMFRDDLRQRAFHGAVQPSNLPHPLEDRTLVLVDDVVYTGRTCRAAMESISAFGRPARIQLAALIDRGHRELPICADYVGRKLPTSRKERIRVRFENLDGEPDSVWLVKPHFMVAS